MMLLSLSLHFSAQESSIPDSSVYLKENSNLYNTCVELTGNGNDWPKLWAGCLSKISENPHFVYSNMPFSTKYIFEKRQPSRKRLIKHSSIDSQFHAIHHHLFLQDTFLLRMNSNNISFINGFNNYVTNSDNGNPWNNYYLEFFFMVIIASIFCGVTSNFITTKLGI